MEIHYTKHAAAYATNLKEAAEAENVAWKNLWKCAYQHLKVFG